MRESLVETILGGVVVLVAGVFLWFGLSASASDGGGDRYEVLARFNNVSGIERGSDVRIAGMKKGIVKDVVYDAERFEARAILAIDGDVQLPADSDARIVTDGLLGGAFVAIEAGGSFDNVANDGSGEIIYTRGAVDLLTLFASFASGGNDGGGSSTDESIPEADYPPVDDSYPDAPGTGE